MKLRFKNLLKIKINLSLRTLVKQSRKNRSLTRLLRSPDKSGFLAMTKGLRTKYKIPHTKYSYLIIGSLFLFSMIGFITVMLNIKPVQAAWFDNNWSYREGIIVTNSTGATVSNIQKSFALNTSTLISAGKLQSNCQDLRFTNEGGKNLSYYIDSGCNTTSTKVWVMIDSLQAGTNNIYMYYGNPSAKAGSTTQGFDNVVGLLGYWTLNDGSGTSAIDSTAYADNGSWSGTTSWGTGVYSSDATFNGTNAYLSMGNVSTLAFDKTNTFSLTAWIKTSSSAQQIIYSKALTTNNVWPGIFFLVTTSGTVNLNLTNTYSSNELSVNTTGTVNNGSWHYVVATYNGNSSPSGISIYIDGVAQSTTTQFNTLSGSVLTTGPVQISGYNSWTGDSLFNGQIDDVHVYNNVRTPQQVALDYKNTYAIQTAGDNITYSLQSEEVGTAPVSYWKFDDGQGVTAYDSTSNKNNATLSGTTKPTWQQESQCISGKCLYFDGASSAVTASDSKFASGANPFSVSLWVKPTVFASGNYGTPFAYGTSGTNNALIIAENGAAGDGSLKIGRYGNDILTTNSKLNLNYWNHVELTYTGSVLTAYINGVNAGSISTTLTTVLGGAYIGYAMGNVQYFQGYIDEVKYYRYARSLGQVLADYNSRGTTISGSEVLGVSTNYTLSNGLLAYYKMDEASYNNVSGEVTDSSGNGNNATGVGYSSTPTVGGVYGDAGTFNGTTQYINAGNVSSMNFDRTNTFSISNWIKTSNVSTNPVIIAKAGGGPAYQGWDLQLTSSGYIIVGLTSNYATTNLISEQSTVTVNDGKWHHIVETYDGSSKAAGMKIYLDNKLLAMTVIHDSLTSSITTSYNIEIGATYGAGAVFNGSIDEMRVYNRVLSSTDVQNLYSYTPGPVAYYNFEEGSGNTLKDLSGYGNNGTWSSSNYSFSKYGAFDSEVGVFPGTTNISIPNSTSTSFNAGSFSLSAWILPPTGNVSQKIFAAQNSSTGYGWVISECGNAYSGATGQSLCAAVYTSGGKLNVHTNTTMTGGKWQYITMVWNAASSSISLYVNGINYPATADLSSAGSFLLNQGVPLYMGTDVNGNNHFIGSMDEVKIYNYPISQTQVLQGMNEGDTNLVDAGSRAGPVGYWKFNEGYGTTAHNSGSGGSTYDASLVGTPVWTNDAVNGKALSLNGSSQYAVPYNGSIVANTSNFTISAWVKSNDNDGTENAIYAENNSIGSILNIERDTSNKFRTGIDQSGNIWTEVEANFTPTIGKWYYLTAVANSSTSTLSLYVNGALSATSSWNGTFLSNPITETYIGNFTNSGNFIWDGSIDEVRVYNYSLTAGQIKSDYYNQGSSVTAGVLGTSSTYQPQAQNQLYCVPGDTSSCAAPVGEWNFQEGQGITVNDTSGNGNNGTWNGTLGNQWFFTKGPNGLEQELSYLNGSNNYVGISSLPTMSYVTIEGWIKTSQVPGTSYGNQIVNRDMSTTSTRVWQFLLAQNGTLRFTPFNSGGSAASSVTSRTINDNHWHFIVGAWDGTTVRTYVDGNADGTGSLSGVLPSVTEGILLGAPDAETGGGYLQGYISGFKIYGYARSAAQILWDYNRGAPLAWWKFDDCQGNLLGDSSGNGYNGTLTIGASGSQTSPGTCNDGLSTSAWYNGVNGKFNSSLNFDGTDDYANIPDNTALTPSNISLSFWVKPSSYPTSGNVYGLIDKRDDAGNTTGYVLEMYNNSGTQQIVWVVSNTGASLMSVNYSLPLNTWSHVVITQAGTAAVMYVNGVSIGTATMTKTLANYAAGLRIGARQDGNYFKGQIDDVRLYNYALTQTQVKMLYSNNAAMMFAPLTGTP